MHRRSIKDPADPNDVEAFVAALRAGELAVLPTETVYGLAADAANPAAAERLRNAKGRAEEQPFSHHIAGVGDLEGLAAPIPARVRRFLDRIWPGPLTVIVPAKTSGETVGLRAPAHPFTRQVIQALGNSLFMTSVNRAGEPPLNDPEAIATAFGGNPSITMLADAGPPDLGEASAIVRFSGRELEVLRPGLLGEHELLVGFAAKVLFVCTGNTCRSPLAEVLARHLVAERLGISDDAVLRHGLCFVSAGTSTMSGMPASEGSLTASREAGMDLTRHRSTLLNAALAAEADRIYCLSDSHRRAVIANVPEAEGKTALLNPADCDVVDPFGAPVEIYRATRDEIATHLRARLEEFLAL